MIINKIILNNYGLYEGVQEFDLRPEKDKNIILIGGENGAGKTTLFDSIKLCL
jgi:DNA sulfur modification protein DndD